ncbi:MAG: hypothetical protein K2W96_02260 [Gemmataceae bacterium]|nr:hypothetical protein [Gemmataceae bacterium]
MLRSLLVLLVFVPAVLALATETKGNALLPAANYPDWKGVLAVINDKSRVYSWWVNGNETFYFKGGSKEMAAALDAFAKIEAKHHVVVVRTGAGSVSSFDKKPVAYDWSLHVIGGIAKTKATNDPKDIDWQRWPVLTLHVGDGKGLAKMPRPKGVTFVVQGGDAAAEKRIKEWLGKGKPEPE